MIILILIMKNCINTDVLAVYVYIRGLYYRQLKLKEKRHIKIKQKKSRLYKMKKKKITI